MSLCDRCADPGRCCRSMPLKRTDAEGNNVHVTFWISSWGADAQRLAAEHALPFEPQEIVGQWLDNDQRPYVALSWSCPKVTAEGRCSIYATRPALCRRYEAASDHLCVMMPPTNQAYPADMRKFGL